MKRTLLPILVCGLFLVLWWQYRVIPSQIQGWIVQLEHKQPSKQKHAFLQLKAFGTRAGPYLVKGMRTGRRDKKLQLGRLLVLLGKDGLPWTQQTLQHKDWRIREIGLTIVSRLPIPASAKLAHLEHAFNDKNPYVRYTAVTELSRLGAIASKLLPAMKKLLKEGTKPLLGHEKTHNHSHTKDEKPHLLSASDQAGGDRHIARIIKGRLCGTPDDVDREVRLAIVRSMSRIETDPKKASNFLLQALQDRDRLIRKETQRHLLLLGPVIAPVLTGYLQKEKAPKQREVATILGKMGEKVFPTLWPLLQPTMFRTTWFHAAHAAQTMKLQQRKTISRLCQIWSKSSLPRQKKLANIIAGSGSLGLSCIRSHLRHVSPSSRAMAAYAVGRWVMAERRQQARKNPHTKKVTSLKQAGLLKRELTTLLLDLHANVWLESAWALGEWGHGARSTLPQLLGLASRCVLVPPSSKPTTSPSVRHDHKACASLLPQVWVKVGGQDPRVNQQLVRLLKDGTFAAKQGSLLALLHSKKLPTSLHTSVFQYLNSSSLTLRREAVEVLTKHPTLLSPYVDKLRHILGTQTLSVQLDTLWLLGRVKRRPVLARLLWPVLQKNLATSSVEKTVKILFVFFQLFPPSHKKSLMEGLTLLTHKSAKVRQQALILLSRSHPLQPGWVGLVMKSLADKDWRVRREAVRTLGVWGPLAKEAEKRVQAMLKDPSYPVSIVAQFSLLKIRGKSTPQSGLKKRLK